MSTPTVSRFENGEKNIQLASALAILGALGMLERPAVEFPDKLERYDPDRLLILFPGLTADGEISCAVSGEALRDGFGARGLGKTALTAAFRAHRSEIEDLAERKFANRQREPDGSILVTSSDI